MRLRWKMNEKVSGLTAIGAAPRGYKYHDGEKQYASVLPLGGGWRGKLTGWYWVAGWDSDVPYKNTCDDPCDTPEDAKKQASDYVKANL